MELSPTGKHTEMYEENLNDQTADSEMNQYKPGPALALPNIDLGQRFSRPQS